MFPFSLPTHCNPSELVPPSVNLAFALGAITALTCAALLAGATFALLRASPHENRPPAWTALLPGMLAMWAALLGAWAWKYHNYGPPFRCLPLVTPAQALQIYDRTLATLALTVSLTVLATALVVGGTTVLLKRAAFDVVQPGLQR